MKCSFFLSIFIFTFVLVVLVCSKGLTKGYDSLTSPYSEGRNGDGGDGGDRVCMPSSLFVRVSVVEKAILFVR